MSQRNRLENAKNELLFLSICSIHSDKSFTFSPPNVLKKSNSNHNYKTPRMPQDGFIFCWWRGLVWKLEDFWHD